MPFQDNEHAYDLLVIGGGINGTGIARDAAGRGLSVLLCERADLASFTSSASTKLIHGGLRYLEYREFRLVREALQERERLQGIAPHIIWPLQFVLPHNHTLRPAWMIRAGLFLYDHLGGRKCLPGSKGIKLHAHPAGEALDPALHKGFVYSDCWAQDSRLVVLNAMDAASRGATILTHTACVRAQRKNSRWHVRLRDDDGEREVRASAVVNAAGPWARTLFDGVIDMKVSHDLRLIKGSHIVVPRLFRHDYAYILQQPDGRIVFAIPYESDYTLVGTTDVDFTGDPATAQASEEEITYLCNAVNHYFVNKLRPEDVIWTYSGVRPLYDDEAGNASAVTRDYVLDLDSPKGQPPLLSIFGGKLTTYRSLAEHAVDQLAPLLNAPRLSWTADTALPGGDIPRGRFELFCTAFKKAHPWLPPGLARRYARHYGTRAERIVTDATEIKQLGRHFGADLYEAEVRYLIEDEWARTAEDILWRRTKLGLRLSAREAAHLENWITRQTTAPDDYPCLGTASPRSA
jgi:glycerol-3-phosphate dehydrogenase